ncbi:hypothetical protein BDP27DRAFT_1428628 [Rhodocollybia butyracea]|uniref:Uncharacterized protein n=1 Tax=Rhodocollybia butyracea TaxID=206335 RepID=A0A9P5PB73_9AGAR|nr:hypothetical protein BDP27DRAFT_1428628 [Rhodocollybia butyracea]
MAANASPSTEFLEELYASYPRPRDRQPSPYAVKVQKANECLPTTKELPPEFQLDKDPLRRTFTKPKRLFYGFGLDYADCIQYHKEQQLPRPPSAKRPFSLTEIIHHVADRLRVLSDFHELDIFAPYATEYDLMLYLYDSYTFKFRELTDKDEEEVIRILKEELPYLKGQTPRWFLPIVQL